MLQIKLLSQAKADFQNIIDYFSSYSATTVKNVSDDIFETINILSSQPDMGRLNSDKTARKTVTSKYKFNIVYRHNSKIIEIISIFRYQDRQF